LALDALAAGVPVSLTQPAPSPVSVQFTIEGGGGVLTNGTLHFTVGQSSQVIAVPTVNAGLYDIVRVKLHDAAGISLGGITTVYYVRTVAAPSPLLITSNSLWRYLDTGGNAGTAWTNLTYNDSGWSNGLAQLGFGDDPRDEATLIRRVGTNGSNTITFYFRQKFEVADRSVFTNLTLWLLRDDGGLVYLNGAEVWRSPNLPAGPIGYLTPATSTGENTIDTTNVSPSRLVNGTNIVAVEIHQQSLTSSDVSFDFELRGQPPPPEPPQKVYWGMFDGQMVLAWTGAGYRLYEAPAVPWATNAWTLSTTVSPFLVNPAAGQRFYQIRR
jgi:hypothetical protein